MPIRYAFCYASLSFIPISLRVYAQIAHTYAYNFRGTANTGPVTSLGQTELTSTRMKENRRKYERIKVTKLYKKIYLTVKALT